MRFSLAVRRIPLVITLASLVFVLQVGSAQAASDAYIAWGNCIDEAVIRLEPSGESATQVAQSAINRCRTRRQEAERARVEMAMAVQPDMDRAKLVADTRAEFESNEARQLEMTTDTVVTIRAQTNRRRGY